VGALWCAETVRAANRGYNSAPLAGDSGSLRGEGSERAPTRPGLTLRRAGRMASPPIQATLPPAMHRVYLDHNATTPLDPRVLEAMLSFFGERFGNPSSAHEHGRHARKAVEHARRLVAELIGATTGEIIFTTSGTEANNAVLATAVRRAVRDRRGTGSPGRIVLSAMEHPSIRRPAAELEQEGFEVVHIPPGPDGRVSADRMMAAIDADTILVCLMLANNELGTLQPVPEVGRACQERGVPFLVDAVQAVGKVPVDVDALHADYLVLGAHKFYGPLGAAALWLRPGTAFEPLIVGGGQERGRRASTENVPAVVGLGEAARLAAEELPRRTACLRALRDRFEAGLGGISGAVVHCAGSPRLPQTSHVAFTGVEGEALLLRLDLAGFAVSTGSACSSGKVEPSATLIAMGIAPEEALSSLRVSFGIANTAEEVDAFLETLGREVEHLRRVCG